MQIAKNLSRNITQKDKIYLMITKRSWSKLRLEMRKYTSM